MENLVQDGAHVFIEELSKVRVIPPKLKDMVAENSISQHFLDIVTASEADK